jgi:putative endonuclease
MLEHNMGRNPESYTYQRRPVELRFYLSFNNVVHAIEFEKQVKGWSRKKKRAFIDENWDKLKNLSACKNRTSHKNYKKGSGFVSAQPDNNDFAQSDE